MAASQTQQIQDLEKSFKVFNRVSSQLEASYHQLENRVTQLHGELSQHHSQLQNKASTISSDTTRLHAILMALPAGVVVLDGSGYISEFNPAAVSLLGELQEGDVWAQVIARVFSPRADDGHEISLRDGRRVSISTCPIGEQPGQVLLINDVTETRDLQDNLGQHQRLMAMGEMAAGLAHQIRTPLASSLLFTSQLKNAQLDDISRLQIVTKVMDQLRQLEALISDMLIFSRSGYSGDESTSAEALLHELENNISNVCEQRQINLVTHCKTAQSIQCNPRILGSALLNLANNAIQAIGKKGTLQLHADETLSGFLEISVIDDGPGIPKNIQQELFKPFFTTRNDGTGLGLAVVQAVARAHGGHVRVQSREGSGSQFVVQLPVAKNNSNTPSFQEAL